MQKLWYFIVICSSTSLIQLAVARRISLENCSLYLDAVSSVNCSDPDFYCSKGHDTHTPKLLSLQGCKNLCGEGFETYDPETIFGGFFLWILPVVVLAAHFHFPPLGWRNTLAVSLGVFGNPIGSLYAMLTRHEVFRRHHRRAAAAGLSDCSIADTARSIATVAAACDEFGWHDPLDFILEHLKNRLPRPAASGADASGADGARVESGGSFDRPGSRRPALGNDITAETDRPNYESLLDPWERLHFAEAQHELVSYRRDTQPGTWFATVGLLAAVSGAFLRAWVKGNRLLTPTTIDVTIMAFCLVSLVQISGNLGSFTSAFGPLIVFQNLQRELRKRDLDAQRSEEKSLVFPISLNPTEIGERLQRQPVTLYLRCRPRTQTSELEMQDQNRPENRLESEGQQQQILVSSSVLTLSKSWLSEAGYLGMNPTWRPHKHMSLSGEKDRSSRCLLVFTFALVSVPWLVALGEAYLTAGCVGFGCVCLTLTAIYLTWVISFFLDHVLKSPRCGGSSYKQLWRRTATKDAIVSLLLASAIIFTHVGMLNTCRCAACTLLRRESEQRIEFSQGTALHRAIQQCVCSLIVLAFICGLIFFVEYDWHTTRTIICPSREQRHSMQLALQKLRADLELNELSSTDDAS